MNKKGVKTYRTQSKTRRIIEIVKTKGPITGEQIADKLNLTRATLRPDLAILTMSGFEARAKELDIIIQVNQKANFLMKNFDNLRLRTICLNLLC